MKLRHILSRQYTDERQAGRPQPLPWLKSPLEERQQYSSFQFENKIPESNPDDGTPSGTTEAIDLSTLMNSEEQTRRIKLPANTQRHLSDRDVPSFRVHHEASSVELFYDLFFVANLATFTSNHPIDDRGSLASYMGFFTLLWFTWFQTSLYDVRFSIDSVFSRVCKALHFGIMTGFAIVGPTFATDQEERDNRAFKSLSIIMMVSRLILVAQYGTVFWFVRGFKRTMVPVTLVIATLFVTAMIFLGMAFAFGPDRGSHAQDGWYIVVVIEALLVLAISSQWRILSFKHTHLVERVGLLTLIILGEGIIGMTKSITNIMQGTTTVTGSSIGMVICAVLIIYFLYILYFDQIDHDRFGTIRQQIWALLHFPLHIGILLTVEGSSEFILFRIGVELSNWSTGKAIGALSADSIVTGAQVLDALNETFDEVASRFTKIPPLDYSKEYSQIKALNISESSTNHTLEEALDIINVMLGDTYAWIFENLGVEVPEKDAESAVTGDEKIEAIGGVFGNVFLYFFISAGCTLVLLSVMYYFGKTHKTRKELISVACRFIMGAGLALLAVMYAVPNQNAFSAFLLSAWILPTVTLIYGTVILIDNLLVWAGSRDLEQDAVDYTLTGTETSV